MACKALDGQVAVPHDTELAKLLDQYVCVRLVQMWGTDLSRFEFDNALTWAVFLLHADGTIYGRYGSRQAYGKATADEMSVAGFKETLRGGLELHQRYGADPQTVGKELASKTGAAAAWKVPEAIPSLKANDRFQRRYRGKHERGASCIHCHMVAVNEVLSLRKSKQPIPDRKFWPFPMPDVCGLAMDPKERATVKSVEAGSAAARAGLKPGDRILRLSGQPILSTADIQWVLHNASDAPTLPAEIERDGKPQRLELTLAKGWRSRVADWRFFNGALQIQTVQFDCVVVPADQRAARDLKADALALRVNRVRPAARAWGLRRGDLIVAVDGKREPMTRGAFTAYVFRNKGTADAMTLTVRRHGEESDVKMFVR